MCSRACHIPSGVTHLLRLGGSGLGPGCWAPVLHQVSYSLLPGAAPSHPLWPLRSPQLLQDLPLWCTVERKASSSCLLCSSISSRSCWFPLDSDMSPWEVMPHCPSVHASVGRKPLPQAGGGMLTGCAPGGGADAPLLGRTTPNPTRKCHCPDMCGPA